MKSTRTSNDMMQGWSDQISAPRVVGGSVLYLDFDGVLHSHAVYVSRKDGTHFGVEALEHGRNTEHLHRLFEHAALLETLLEPYQEVKIVLSTTWAQKSYLKAKNRLPQSLKDRCIGSTFHRGMNLQQFRSEPRGLQVYADVLRRAPKRWIALDDNDSGWPACTADFFVRTDEHLGISAPHVLSSIEDKLRVVFG